MYFIHVIIASVFLQAFIINSIDANVIRHRRQQQQASGTLYGNSNLAPPNQPAGYNYPSNTNFYGANLNNPGSKDLYGNPMGPSNPGNPLNNMQPLNNQQQQQQQQQHQMYGAGGQQLSNPSFSGNGLYSPNAANQVNANIGMRDNSANLMPAGSPGASLYPSSNPQMGYLGNTNQGLVNKDLYNPQSNQNNNQYGLNANLYPNSNTYGGGQQMPNNNNNNQWANNNNNQFNPNAGNAWSQNRDLNPNTHNTYSNPNSPYFYNNDGQRIMTSCFILFLSFIAITFFHI